MHASANIHIKQTDTIPADVTAYDDGQVVLHIGGPVDGLTLFMPANLGTDHHVVRALAAFLATVAGGPVRYASALYDDDPWVGPVNAVDDPHELSPRAAQRRFRTKAPAPA